MDEQSDGSTAMHIRARKRSRAETKKRYAKLLRRWEASQYLLEVHGLQFAPASLAKKACLGIGPEICFVNTIPFYQPTALDAWAKAKISKPTTQAKKDPYHRNRRRLKPDSANIEPPVVAA
jgi:hypothetical protein